MAGGDKKGNGNKGKWRQNKGKKFNPPRHAEDLSIAPPLPRSTGLPVPQHLSKTATPLTNDPLWLNSLCNEGLTGVTQIEAPKTYSASHDSFFPLLETDYEAIVAANKTFGKMVPRSLYRYYNVMHLWARLLAVDRQHGRTQEDERRFLTHFEHLDQYKVSNTVNLYLRGIGDFKDPTGIKHYAGVPRRPNENGHYGRASAQSHNFYEAVPAPAVVWECVRSDFLAQEPNTEWDIAEITPAAVNAAPVDAAQAPPHPEIPADDDIAEEGVAADPPDQDEAEAARLLPTVNLLGWQLAQPWTNQQRTAILGAGFSADNPAYDVTRYRLKVSLLSYVSTCLISSPLIKTSSTLHESSDGSIVQTPFLRVPELFDRPSRFRHYCENQVTTFSRTALDDRLIHVATVCGYRVKKAVVMLKKH
ncbi:hypothetical protein AAG570_011455 [Ranatra chinensis]|uniref:Capsid protein n=1 Tax=Ranatra chinensis TaxID=642074 RepID=A0ABD0YKX1_9HEMI